MLLKYTLESDMSGVLNEMDMNVTTESEYLLYLSRLQGLLNRYEAKLEDDSDECFWLEVDCLEGTPAEKDMFKKWSVGLN